MGKAACPEKPPEGAEDGDVAIFRPVPGLDGTCNPPTARAVGFHEKAGRVKGNLVAVFGCAE